MPDPQWGIVLFLCTFTVASPAIGLWLADTLYGQLKPETTDERFFFHRVTLLTIIALGFLCMLSGLSLATQLLNEGTQWK